MSRLVSVNVARLSPTVHTTAPEGLTGIDKRPVNEPVEVRAPASGTSGTSGLVGDRVGDSRRHGGVDKAVYAYAREDLDDWSVRLGRPLAAGCFGENLTTQGVAVSDALIGERWRVGTEVVLEVSVPRIPCRTFAGWLGEAGWVRAFTAAAIPGAYLRVVTPGVIRVDDPVEVVSRPDHEVTIAVTFRALTLEPELRPWLSQAVALPEKVRQPPSR